MTIQRYISKENEKLPAYVVNSQVDEILNIYKEQNSKSIKQIRVLDVGSGVGDYSFALSKKVKEVVGEEPFSASYLKSASNSKYKKSNVSFHNKKIEDFRSGKKFDLALSLTTIEHMPEAEKSFEKIFSLLKSGGMIYLTAPNKLWPIECHYHLPFLSWLPLSISNLYVKIFRNVDSYEDCSYSKTYWEMKKFFNKFDCEYKFILPKDAGYIGCGSAGFFSKQMVKWGTRLISRNEFFWAFSKGFIMLIKKN